MVKIENQLLYQKLWDKNGTVYQLNVVVEELSELIHVICKMKRGSLNLNHLSEEMAHVKVMIEQMEIAFNNGDKVKQHYDEAIERIKLLVKG